MSSIAEKMRTIEQSSGRYESKIIQRGKYIFNDENDIIVIIKIVQILSIRE